VSAVDGPLPLRRARVSVLFAFDAARSIDLAEARRHVVGEVEPSLLEHKRRAPTYFQFEPPPLRVLRADDPGEVLGRRFAPHAECAVFDFGAISVRYHLPFEGTLDDVPPLTAALAESPRLVAAARRLAEGLLDVLRPAAVVPVLAPIVEDYVVLEVDSPDAPGSLDAVLSAHAAALTRALGAFEAAPSDEEVAELLSHRASYGTDDLVVVDWNAALVLGRDMADVVDVLEFANVQLLEMRFLDGRLDDALDRAYEAIARRPRPWLPRVAEPAVERVARMQVDAAILFERVGNALKLVGDQWLARVYRLAAQRFHLPEWNAGILRKLDTLESVYQKTFDRASARRMETLEWLIIALIALSMLIPLL
jgi:hypothetical protein